MANYQTKDNQTGPHLDVEAGWRRVKLDLSKRRGFVRHPFLRELIAWDEAGWIDALNRALIGGIYRPSPMEVCDVPKGGGALRPGSVLRLEDAVVYAACVDAAFERIYERIASARRTFDFAYRLRDPANRDGWFLDQFAGWKDFDRASIGRIQAGAQWVVVADIAGYFEHVDLSQLFSDLRAIGVNESVLQQLSTLLNNWTYVSGRGIPQGQSPSDILGKLYLTSVDENLASQGFDHIRYVDDIRVFCDDVAQARKAILSLSRLLRARGLSVQAAKLQILRSDKAQEKFEGVRAVVANLERAYAGDLNDLLGSDAPSMSVTQAEEALAAADVDEYPTEVLRKVWMAHFSGEVTSFNGTLFRFLLGRLGRANDAVAVPRVLDFLVTHPDQTAFIIKYLGATGSLPVVEDRLAAFVTSAEAVYEFQLYEIIEGVLDAGFDAPGALGSIIGRIAFDRSRPPYLKAVARCHLGRFGSASDLELLQAEYSSETSDIAQAEIICALTRMERIRRNSFYQRVQNSGDLQRRAVQWATQRRP